MHLLRWPWSHPTSRQLPWGENIAFPLPLFGQQEGTLLLLLLWKGNVVAGLWEVETRPRKWNLPQVPWSFLWPACYFEDEKRLGWETPQWGPSHLGTESCEQCGPELLFLSFWPVPPLTVRESGHKPDQESRLLEVLRAFFFSWAFLKWKHWKHLGFHEVKSK